MEHDLIQWLQQRLPGHGRALVGVGDDAAVLPRSDTDWVVTTDALMDGVDFDLEQVDARRAGHKALAVNLSDLAAMAARPLAALVSLVLPQAHGLSLAKQLYEGMLPLAQRHGVEIVGGDTNSWSGPLVISVTAIGCVQPPGPWLRQGGRPEDAVLVTGALGGSILGKHLDFEPRVREAQAIIGSYRVHAAIDVSDGLSWDLAQLAHRSGCGAAVDLDNLPIDPAAVALSARPGSDRTALQHALGDGEDFELILAMPQPEARRLLDDQPLEVPVTRIGQLIEQSGLWQRRGGEALTPLPPQGYQHRLDA